jgi:DNA primase
MILQSTIDEILNLAQIEDVVGEYVTLKKRGVRYVGLCPFHNEKTPSFTVTPAKEIYKCFGCGRAGNVITFLMEHENMSYPESLLFLADKYQIEVKETKTTVEDELVKDAKESLYVLNDFAEKYFQDKLQNTEDGQHIGLAYFTERGFSKKTVEKFKLGFAPNINDSFYQYATENGYKPEILTENGLIKKSNDKYFDFFRDRVIFPIHNLSGKVIAFAARTLRQDKKIPKYVNSPESIIYNKSKVLYGMFFARQAIRKERECFVVEGYTDVISLHQGGIENVVASSGTSLTEQQVYLIKRFTENVTMLFDGDEAGLNAALRGVEKILEAGLNVNVVMLPENEDPDSYLKKDGAINFRDYIKKNATDFILFKLKREGDLYKNDPVKKSEWIKETVDTIALIPEPITRETYIRECAKLMEINFNTLINYVNKSVNQKLKRRQAQWKRKEEINNEEVELITDAKPAREPQISIDGSEEKEKNIIRVMLNYIDKKVKVEGVEEFVHEYVFNEIENIRSVLPGSKEFATPVYKRIFDFFKAHFEQETEPDIKALVHHEDEQIRKTVTDMLAGQYQMSDNWEKQYQIYAEKSGDVYEKDVFDVTCNYLMSLVRKSLEGLLGQMKDEKDDDKLKELNIEFVRLKTMQNQLASKFNTVILP